MGFTSQIFKREIVIDDSTPGHVTDPTPGMSCGLDLSARGFGAYEYGNAAEPFDNALLIPRSEWQARIQEMEEQKSRTSDAIKLAKLPAKDQNGTNYCWINAPVHCLEIIRAQQNQEMIILSPASGGAQIKGYRNEGGWGKEALQWIATNGVCPVSAWPANAIDKRYATAANKALALTYRVDEWTECQPRNLDQMISMLLRRIPGAGGYNFWSHEVSLIDAVWLNGAPGVRIRNQWQGWGDDNFAILQGSKMLADDLVFPRSALAT